jgi:hypothetical protein
VAAALPKGAEMEVVGWEQLEEWLGAAMIEGHQRWADLMGLTIPDLVALMRCLVRHGKRVSEETR